MLTAAAVVVECRLGETFAGGSLTDWLHAKLEMD